MNTNIGRTSKACTWAAAGIMLGALAVLGGAPMSAQAAADRTPVPSETDSLAVIRQNAPAVARAIANDKELRSVVGADKWPLALHRLAEFSKKTDADHKDALRIIGDTVTRVKNPVGTIKLDGDPSEWSESIPSPDSAQLPKYLVRNNMWAQGAAAVVRQDRLYLLACIADAAQYFAHPNNELRVTMDCRGDEDWDVCLSISKDQGAWIVKQMPFGSDWRKAKPLQQPAQGSLGAAAEMAIPIRDFVPPTEAKPRWSLYLQAEAKNAKPKWTATRDFPVLNENAREGVAAWPYVRTFLYLCADQPLDDFELTAAAIAITSAATYLEGDEEVRKKVRVDNADFLEFARSIDTWQAEIGANYRLKKYPLEAQLAWADRTSGGNHHANGPKPIRAIRQELERKSNLEVYYSSTTSVETLKKLKALAIKEKLADASLSRCGALIDDWVQKKQVAPYNTTTAPSREGDLRGEEQEGREAAPAESRRTWGDLKGEAREARVNELKAIPGFNSSHAETLLKQIEKYGYVLGDCHCGQHSPFCRTMMRALGIAPLGFWAVISNGERRDHAWPGWYDPAQKVWWSYQKGRGDKNKWLLVCRRPAVFSYVVETLRAPNRPVPQDTQRPFPLVLCRELRGFKIAELSRAGIPTKEIREWMLTPGF